MAGIQIKMTVHGAKELKRTLGRIPRAEERLVAQALHRESEAIMTEAKRRVPVMLGNLRASGHVALPEFHSGFILSQGGFGGPAGSGNQGETNKIEVGYALPVHENPRAGKTGGFSPRGVPYRPRPGNRIAYAHTGEYKYYENPAKEAAPGLARRMSDFIRARQARIGR